MNSLNLFVVTTIAALGATGCYTGPDVLPVPAAPVVVEPAGAVPSNDLIVTAPPPADLVEAQDIPPSPNHVWIPGHWTREADRWIWIKGQWEVRPSPIAVYFPGRWEQLDNGTFTWREGHWKE